MDVQDLLKGPVEVAGLPPVLLFCPGAGRGKNLTFESVLAEQAVKNIVDAAIDPSLRDMAYALMYADEADPGSVVLEAQMLPFLTERRVVEVRNADVYNAETRSRHLLKYLESPNPATLLILIAANVDRRMKFFKACQRAGQIVECPELSVQAVAEWIREQVRDLGKEIDAGAVQEISDRAGTHLSDVRNALEVAAAYVGGVARIRREDVLAACADVKEEEVWALTDAIAVSDMGAALLSLRRLLDLGTAPDEILGTINWLLKSAYAVAAPDYGQSLNPFVAKKVTPLAKKLGVAKIRDAFALCTKTQLMMRSTGTDPELAIELMVIKLTWRPEPRRAAAKA